MDGWMVLESRRVVPKSIDGILTRKERVVFSLENGKCLFGSDLNNQIFRILAVAALKVKPEP